MRRARRYAKKRGLAYRYDHGKGKGSHGQLYVGARRTTVKRSEVKNALPNTLLKELGIRREDI